MINIPQWASTEVSNFRTNRTLGEGAQRKELGAEAANMLATQLGQQMDQLAQLDESDADGAKGRPGVFSPKEMPQLPIPIPMAPPEIHFEGNSQQGSNVTINEGMAQAAVVNDFNADSVDVVMVLGGPMAGNAMAIHVDRKNPGASYVEQKGEIWNMMGGMMGQAMAGGGGFPGFPGFG